MEKIGVENNLSLSVFYLNGELFEKKIEKQLPKINYYKS